MNTTNFKFLPVTFDDCLMTDCDECRANNKDYDFCQRAMKLMIDSRISKSYESDYTPHSTRAYHYRANRVIAMNCIPYKCERCGAYSRIEVHHIDRDISNNVITNLEVLCRSCHEEEHKND